MSKRTFLCGIALALIVAGSPRPAGAEWFFDLYGGGAFTKDADITIRNGTTLHDTLKFDTEATGGGRIGFYLAPVVPWLGFAIDGSYYGPATSSTGVDARLEVVPITGLVLLRLPFLPRPRGSHGSAAALHRGRPESGRHAGEAGRAGNRGAVLGNHGRARR